MSAFTNQFRFAVQSNRLVSSDNEVFFPQTELTPLGYISV